MLSWTSTPLYDCHSFFMSFILRAIHPNPDSLPILGLRTISGDWVDSIVVFVAFALEFTQKTRHDGHIGCFYLSNGESRKRLCFLLTPKNNRIIPVLLTSVQGGTLQDFLEAQRHFQIYRIRLAKAPPLQRYGNRCYKQFACLRRGLRTPLDNVMAAQSICETRRLPNCDALRKPSGRS